MKTRLLKVAAALSSSFRAVPGPLGPGESGLASGRITAVRRPEQRWAA